MLQPTWILRDPFHGTQALMGYENPAAPWTATGERRTPVKCEVVLAFVNAERTKSCPIRQIFSGTVRPNGTYVNK